MMYRIIIVLIAAFTCVGAQAQQQVMFTQYLYNMLPLNPAYAGSHESMSVTALAREQWTGLDGAPATQTFNIHSPLPGKNAGLGLTVINDRIGISNQTGVYGAYSYQLPFGNGAKLSFGIQGGATFYRTNFSQVDAEDPAFNYNMEETRPNFGFGMLYYSDKFFAGVSVPQLLESELDSRTEVSNSIALRHYFAIGGYVFDINEDVKLKPTVLVKYVEGAPTQFDLSANVLLKETLGLGVSWRSFDSFDALAQLQLTDQLQLGYAYDFLTTSRLSSVNAGSHELMINYRFSFNKANIISPRYF